MPKSRLYEKSHPWLTFNINLASFPYDFWMLLGEVKSKCDHIAGVPLQPALEKRLQNLYLSKGIHATTAIEGNTLTEEEVLKRLEGNLPLPPSREYLGAKVDNVLNAINYVGSNVLDQRQGLLTVEDICKYNELILKGLELEKGVIPGHIRPYTVGVARYLAAPPEDCEFLLGKLCTWLNAPEFCKTNDESVVYGLIRAILAHLYLAWIHPFGDGNGRTARLVEFQILLAAGVPAPAAHLLSNHYNQTRTEYYNQLNYASESKGNLVPFFRYALTGLRDGLKEQLAYIRHQQHRLAWRDYVHEVLGGDDKASIRQRHLVLDLSKMAEPVLLRELTQISPRVARAYATLTGQTLSNDIKELIKMRLIVKNGKMISANPDFILAFLPNRFDPSTGFEPGQEALDLGDLG